MSNHQIVNLDGTDYVILKRTDFQRLIRLSKAADLPVLPRADAQGNYPARQYLRATLARKIIRDRAKAGLSQRQLAALAAVRFETICRIETGKNTPDIATIDKIDRALKVAMKQPRVTHRKQRGTP